VMNRTRSELTITFIEALREGQTCVEDRDG
jgi:hypothetical protein